MNTKVTNKGGKIDVNCASIFDKDKTLTSKELIKRFQDKYNLGISTVGLKLNQLTKSGELIKVSQGHYQLSSESGELIKFQGHQVSNPQKTVDVTQNKKQIEKQIRIEELFITELEKSITKFKDNDNIVKIFSTELELTKTKIKTLQTKLTKAKPDLEPYSISSIDDFTDYCKQMSEKLNCTIIILKPNVKSTEVIDNMSEVEQLEYAKKQLKQVSY